MADTNTNADIAKAVLKPGEQTSEYKAKQEGSFWSKITMFAGIAIAIIPQVIAALQQSGADQSKTGTMVISILGVVLSIAGIVTNGSVNKSYVEGRSLVKAAGARDLDLNSTQVPKI
jgi:hypothetical protein